MQEFEDENPTWTPEDIYRLSDSGLNNADVAVSLKISDSTVGRHLKWRKENRQIVKKKHRYNGQIIPK